VCIIKSDGFSGFITIEDKERSPIIRVTTGLVIPAIDAVMSVVPEDTAVTSPEEDTEALLASELFHTTLEVMSVL